MIRLRNLIVAAPGLVLAGCAPTATDAPPSLPAPSGYHREADPSPRPSPLPGGGGVRGSNDVIPKNRVDNPRYSWETDADHAFADFLKGKSGGMVRQAAVGLEKSGKLRVQLDSAVSPEDTLPLTKSILAGARKDFPGKTFTLSVYDPSGEPILRARQDPQTGVRYQVVEHKADPEKSTAPPARAGGSDRDRKFAEWAENAGRQYLRYVEVDLEKNGRLWFGVSKDVKPADVPDLTKSLLQGAREEFPDREIVATVFDPEGERIGRARLGKGSQVQWEK